MLSAIAVYALYLAPVALSGHPTWPGYNFVNDTASNFIFADLLGRQGVSLPDAIDSSTATIEANPVNLGYPMGAHGLLATVRPLTGADLAAVYHPLISAVAGIAAMAISGLAAGRAATEGRGGGRSAADWLRAALPLRAARRDQGGAGGGVPGHLRSAGPRGARPRAEPAARRAHRALRCRPSARVQRRGGGLRTRLGDLPAWRRAGRGPPADRGRPARRGRRGHRGRGRGREPVRRQGLRRPRGRRLRERGRSEHRLSRPPRSADTADPDRRRLAVARLPLPGAPGQRVRERRADRDFRPPGGRGCGFRGAPPAPFGAAAARTRRGCRRRARAVPLPLRRRQAAGGVVPGGLLDGCHRRARAARRRARRGGGLPVASVWRSSWPGSPSAMGSVIAKPRLRLPSASRLWRT